MWPCAWSGSLWFFVPVPRGAKLCYFAVSTASHSFFPRSSSALPHKSRRHNGAQVLNHSMVNQIIFSHLELGVRTTWHEAFGTWPLAHGFGTWPWHITLAHGLWHMALTYDFGTRLWNMAFGTAFGTWLWHMHGLWHMALACGFGIRLSQDACAEEHVLT